MPRSSEGVQLLRWVVLVWVVGVGVQAQSNNNNNNKNNKTDNTEENDVGACTLCADGSAPLEGATLGGTTDCSFIDANLAMTPADSDDCVNIQIEGYRHCGCPTLPESICSMCDYSLTTSTANGNSSGFFAPLSPGFANVTTRLMVPGDFSSMSSEYLRFFQCQELEFVPRRQSSNQEEQLPTCADVRGQAYFCGCAGSVRPLDCFLCPNSSTTSGFQSPEGFAGSRYLPDEFTNTCANLDRDFGSFPVVDNNSTNNRECQSENYISSIMNLRGYCGCDVDDVPTPVPEDDISSCNLCGNNENDISNPDAKVNDIGVTCRDIGLVASFVTNASYCQELQMEMNVTCCTSSTSSTTTEPDNTTNNTSQKNNTAADQDDGDGSSTNGPTNSDANNSTGTASDKTNTTLTPPSSSNTTTNATNQSPPFEVNPGTTPDESPAVVLGAVKGTCLLVFLGYFVSYFT